MNKNEAIKVFEDYLITRHVPRPYELCEASEVAIAAMKEDQPSLPSDVDEAAEQAMPLSYDSLEVGIYGGSEPVYSYEQMVEMFRAGAKWQAEHLKK